MRIKIGIATAIAFAAIHAAPAAAQVATSQPSATITPLPALLVPAAPPAADEARARFPMRRVLISTGIGTLVGAGAGLVVGTITTDGCQRGEEWCILSWEEEVAIHGVAGAMVGAGIGAIYGLVSAPRRTDTRSAPVSVAPAMDGGVRVGLTLRH